MLFIAVNWQCVRCQRSISALIWTLCECGCTCTQLSYSATNMASTQKTYLSCHRRGDPTSKHMVMGTNRAKNDERLCWRGPPSIHWTWAEKYVTSFFSVSAFYFFWPTHINITNNMFLGIIQSSDFYFKTQRFGDWILSLSSGKSYSLGPNR
jgi:hypothetical protein